MPTTNQLKPRPAPLRPTITGLAPTDLNPSGKSYGQMIIDQVDQGIDIVNAAQAAGVSMAQLGDWNREGQTHYSRYLAGADWATDFTAAQQDAVWFHTTLQVALARHKVKLALITEQLARGGLQRTSTRTKRNDGKVVEETVTVETLLPDAEMLRWKLERLAPDVYGRSARLDVMVHDLTDSETQMSIVEQRVEAIRRQRELRQQAVDTTESPDGG